jgi:hypothetical protein
MKTWQKPQLIVLVRSKPEEALLGTCKAATFGASPQNEWPGCAVADSQWSCMACDAIGNS